MIKEALSPLLQQLRKKMKQQRKQHISSSQDGSVKNKQALDLAFLDAMKDVKPLLCDRVILPVRKHDRCQVTTKLAQISIRQHSDEEDIPLLDMLSDAVDWLELDCRLILTWVRDGYDQGILKRMQQGKVKLDHRVDLHGCTVAQARNVLSLELHLAAKQHYRYVLFIHGKGNHMNSQGVLKAKVNQWLRLHEHVVAFHSAPNQWGGAGAVVCMLKDNI